MVGCFWWECVDYRSIDSADVQIPREFFPDNAAYSRLGPDDSVYGAIEHQAQNIFWGEYGNSSAILHVYRYPGTSRAKRGFDTEVRILDDLFEVFSQQSSQLDYQSVSADQLVAGCGKKWTPTGYKCAFVARYQQDLISFNMTIDRQMTLEDFESIILYLDTSSVKGLGH